MNSHAYAFLPFALLFSLLFLPLLLLPLLLLSPLLFLLLTLLFLHIHHTYSNLFYRTNTNTNHASYHKRSSNRGRLEAGRHHPRRARLLPPQDPPHGQLWIQQGSRSRQHTLCSRYFTLLCWFLPTTTAKGKCCTMTKLFHCSRRKLFCPLFLSFFVGVPFPSILPQGETKGRYFFNYGEFFFYHGLNNVD